MYRLGLLSEWPKQDVGKLIALTVTAGFFGVFFVIPLRKYYIVGQKLSFPTPAATAITIRALHNSRTDAVAARKKLLALLSALVIVFIYKVVSGHAPGFVSLSYLSPNLINWFRDSPKEEDEDLSPAPIVSRHGGGFSTPP